MRGCFSGDLVNQIEGLCRLGELDAGELASDAFWTGWWSNSMVSTFWMKSVGFP